MDNIIDIELTGRSTRREQKLWQYDYGQVLRIAGKEFPKVTEVQFSLKQSGGHTLDRIGTSNNGLLTVQIPNELLQNKGATSDYTIYAFLYLSGDGFGNTKYMIQLPVESRPEPTDPSEDPSTDPSIFKDAVNAVNASADRAEAAEKSAKESADKAKEYAESAGKSKGDVEKARDNAISAIGTEKESALRGIASKTDESVQKLQSQAEESQNSIKQSISDATEKKTELDGAISNATDAKGNLEKAVKSAGNAKKDLDASVGKAGEAKTSLDSSISSAGEKQLALDATVEQANAVDASLKEQIGSAEQIQANVEQIAKNKADISSLNEDLSDLDGAVFNTTQEFKDCTADATVLPDKFVCLFTSENGTLLLGINDGKDISDCYVISVNENDKFQVKGIVFNNNLYYPLIVMSSASFANNSIEQGSLVTAENGNYSYWGTGNETGIYEFVIPKGVKALLVNKFSGESEFLLKKLVDVKKSKIPTKISELENDTLFLSREMYTPQYNIYTGQIRSSGDFLPVYDVKDDGAYQVTEMIPVSKGDKVYYSGSFYSYPAVALYDKFGTWVSDLSGDLKIYVQYDNVEVREITCDGFVAAYSYKQVGGSNVKLALDVYGNKAQNEINSKYKMNYLYVATTGNDETGDGSASNPFASIYHANDIIHSNSPRNRFTIIVKNGTYTDLQERYSGVGSSGVYQGVKTKHYVYYQSETPERPDLCVIKWNGATGLTTPCALSDVNDKAPFHVCGELLPFCMHTKIKGFTFDCKNTRYSVHIEMAGATLENEWAFENCIFKFEGRPDITDDSNKTAPIVGIGSGFSENGMFRNCVFENLQKGYNQAINVHDNEFMPSDITPYMLKGFTYVIDGCLFKSCNLIGLGSIHQAENKYDIDNMLYLKQCSGVDTVNANENMKYKFIDI